MSENFNIDNGMEELEKLIEKIETEPMTMLEGVKTYEQASAILEACYKQLDDCKNRINAANERVDIYKESVENAYVNSEENDV